MLWWQENRSDAPGAVREDLDATFDLICSFPAAGRLAASKALAGVRRIHLRRIRYHVYYRLLDQQNTVEVLAVWHSSRGAVPPLDVEGV